MVTNNPLTPDAQNFAGRLRGHAAFLASNYKELSAAEAQVIVKALESAADHVEAYLAARKWASDWSKETGGMTAGDKGWMHAAREVGELLK